MQGKELLKYFRTLPEYQQTKILVDAYKQIAVLHQGGKSYDSFTWRNCCLESDELKIVANVDKYFNEESLQRNLLDYAGVIYCLTTGSKSAEAMSWDAGRKIQSPVLREIVLTICGRNNSVSPLIEKLKQPYKDEDTFFEGYSTVDEKEGREAAEKKRRIDAENRIQETEDLARLKQTALSKSKKKWYEGFGVIFIMVLCSAGYKACRASNEIQHNQSTRQIEHMYQQRSVIKESLKGMKFDLPYRSKPTGD